MINWLHTNKWRVAFGSALIIFGVAFINIASGPARIASGYQAKILCSEVFVAGREADEVLARDFDNISPALKFLRAHVDINDRSVSTALFGLGQAKAVYHDETGCTLLPPNPKQAANRATGKAPQASHQKPTSLRKLPTARPISSEALTYIDYGRLNHTLDIAFEPDNPANTRAMLILVDGKVVEERYAEGFSSSTKFLSWSMAKSILATTIGTAADRQIIDLDAPLPVPEWQTAQKPGTDHPKENITWRHMLHMQSGLAFEEDYAKTSSDVNQMLFRSADMGALAAAAKIIHPPNDFFHYSSGTTNLLSRTLDQQLRERGQTTIEFARDNILSPIGVTSAVFETDPSGVFVGSSYFYATAQDWARLGQLYLQEGTWDDQQILSADWVDFVQAPAGAADGQYGAHFWLNRDGKEDRTRFFPGLPENVYFMAGHEGQYVLIVPDKKLVIFRAGQTRHDKSTNVLGPVFAEIYASVGKARTP